MSSLLKNLLFALGLAVILWLGYTIFLKDDGELIETTEIGSSQAALEAQEFLVRLRELNGINLQGEIFDDVRFTSLVNFRQELGEEPAGRENPFAPVE